MADSTRLFILTRGRVNKQKTLSELSKFMWPHTTLVCPKKEKSDLLELVERDYPGVTVLGQPESIGSLAEKRKYIAELSIRKNINFIQADDDLTLRALDPSSKKFVNSKKIQKLGWAELSRFMRTGYAPVVGFGTRAFSQKIVSQEEPHRFNYHLGFIWGMTPEAAEAIEWGRLALYEDIDYTLQTLKAGFRNVISYRVVVAQPKGERAGGLYGERTDELVTTSLRRLIKFHPDVVTTKESSGQHSMSNTRVAWAKAAKIGGCSVPPKKAE